MVNQVDYDARTLDKSTCSTLKGCACWRRPKTDSPTSDDFVRTNLVEQAWQHRRIAGGIVRHLNGTDFQGRGIYAQMHLAPLPPVVRAMFLRFPFTFAQYLDAGTIDQQVQPCRRRVCCNRHSEMLLSAVHGAEIRHFPI